MHWTLEPHPDPAARSRAVSTGAYSAGTRVLVAEAAAIALLPALKGARCDWCLRAAPNLRRCSRCAGYYYCGAECQNAHWAAGGHKRVCRLLPAFLAARALAPERLTDALLLTHLLAAADNDGDQLAAVRDLLPHPAPPPTPPTVFADPDADADALYARFENNNFVLHAHLAPLAAAVVPRASRALNHSCAPNAVPLFVFAAGAPPRMEVVLVRDVLQGEEITIPYIDPALPRSARRERLRASYNFTCSCPRCTSPLPGGIDIEDDIPALAEQFSAASHDGPFDAALAHGAALLALYRALYPPFYPLIGLHLSELAKTAWNASLQLDAPALSLEHMRQAAEFVRQALDVLGVLGEEGDAPHPREEMMGLAEMLAREGVRV